MCFKREFHEQDAMSIWASCWTNIQTDYFHLFIALAIITSYSDDVLQHSLPADEMLLHFSNLAHHMNGKLILQKVSRAQTPVCVANRCMCLYAEAELWFILALIALIPSVEIKP